MIEVLSVKNMRESDALTIQGGVPGRELMYRAGKCICETISDKVSGNWKEPVAIVCGSGNNAGDGYVLAELLHDQGIPCVLFLLEDRFSEDGKYYYDQCMKKGVPSIIYEETTSFEGYGMIVDCIFGTGFRGEVREPAAGAIRKINESNAFVVSVDINSGLNGDSGMASLCVQSDLTISIGSYQPGHFLSMAKDVMKEKVNCDIGIRPANPPFCLVEESDLRDIIPARKHFSNKGTYGYTALVGGCLSYSGAIRLAAMANGAMRAGAGVVKIATARSLCPLLVPQILESTLFPLSDKEGEIVFCEEEAKRLIANVKTVAFGMGIGKTIETEKLLLYLLENYKGTMIVDADGLNILAEQEESTEQAEEATGQAEEAAGQAKCRLVLTPHVKEFARLCHCDVAEVLNRPIDLAKEYAAKYGVVLLLKGPTTIITDGDKVYLVDAGCPGMATAGSGDVLSGILAAICGYCPDLFDAVVLGAYINGRAGEKAEAQMGAVSMTAVDTVEHVAEVALQLLR